MTLVIDLLGDLVALDVPDAITSEVLRALVDLPLGDPTVGDSPRRPSRRLSLAPSRRDTFVLLDDGAVVLDDIDPRVGVATLVWRLNAIVGSTSHHVVLHAGCAAAGGGALCLPGRSGSGKSWLTAALVSAGWDYLSDEHTPISLQSGLVDPVPKPLDLGRRGLVAASALRAASIAAPTAPAAVVFPHYTEGGELAITPVDPASLLLELCDHATNLVPLGAGAFLALVGVATSCPAIHLHHGGDDEAVRALEAWRAGPARTERPRLRPDIPVPAITPTSTTVLIEDEAVVFDAADGTVHRLNASAALVWLSAAGAAARAEVVERVLDQAPAGTIPPAEVSATVDRFVELGLLDLGDRDRTPGATG